jgi:hypothetical protein
LGVRRRHRGEAIVAAYRSGLHVDDHLVIMDLTDESRPLEGQGP